MNNFKIDGKSFQKIDKFLDKYNKGENNSFNKFTIRKFVKEFFKIYAG